MKHIKKVFSSCEMYIATSLKHIALRNTGTGRMYQEEVLIEDSAFPFRPDEPLIVKIDRSKVVVERA